jgi:hypothetical protein
MAATDPKVTLTWLRVRRAELVARLEKLGAPPARQELDDLAAVQAAIAAFEAEGRRG